MAVFNYTARDAKGAITKGDLYASDRQTAAASLIDRKLVPILIKEAKTSQRSGRFILTRFIKPHKVKLQDKVVFSRQLATMVNAGVPIVSALNILEAQTSSKTLKAVLADLAKQVQGGASLSKAMSDHPNAFNPVYVNMVKAGESGGILDQVLERLATQQEKDAEIIHKVRGAMIYPGVITTVTIAAFFFMMTVIVPKMATIFDSFNATLPAYTRGLLAISKFLTHDSTIILVGVVALGFGVYRYVRTRQGKQVLDNLVIRLPLFGMIVRKVNIARFARTLGSLVSSGISILDALNTTSEALGNSVFKSAIVHIAQEVKNGRPINEGLRQNKIFPPIISQMVLVGEETGQLDAILLKVAEFYEKEVQTVVENLTSVIEPVLIIIIGALIGSIVIGILGPLGSLTNSI